MKMAGDSNKNKDALSERAYKEIMQRIITFQYKPNEVIVEADVCKDLNVSRTPLREALRRLESEGLVLKVRNQGTFVRSFTEKDIIEICDYRKLLEVYSLRGCVEFADDEELKSIEMKKKGFFYLIVNYQEIMENMFLKIVLYLFVLSIFVICLLL